jgi:hypothetical protein
MKRSVHANFVDTSDMIFCTRTEPPDLAYLISAAHNLKMSVHTDFAKLAVVIHVSCFKSTQAKDILKTWEVLVM